MADSHGGKRPGSGRKPQSETIKKVSPEIINAGILPLEMRLRVARKMWAAAIDESGEIVDLDKAKEAADFAEAALPYTSARLQTIEHSGPDGGAIQFESMSDAQLDAAIARIGIALGTRSTKS